MLKKFKNSLHIVDKKILFKIYNSKEENVEKKMKEKVN